MKRARKKNQTPKAPTSKNKSVKTKGKTKNNNKSKKRLKIFLISLVAALALVFVALGISVQDNALIPIDTSTGTMNVLLLGVDEDGLRTDAIMIASYNFDNE